jgi:hypothetical protein
MTALQITCPCNTPGYQNEDEKLAGLCTDILFRDGSKEGLKSKTYQTRQPHAHLAVVAETSAQCFVIRNKVPSSIKQLNPVTVSSNHMKLVSNSETEQQQEPPSRFTAEFSENQKLLTTSAFEWIGFPMKYLSSTFNLRTRVICQNSSPST